MQHFKKSLGQNFLIDKNISKKIIKLINNYEKKNIIEVGPGKGALTDFILKKNPKKLLLIEKDKFLYKEILNKYKKYNTIETFNCDALDFNYKKIDKPKSIIANLPYNISIKLIVNWIQDLSDFNEIVVMIQKEVAQKMDYKKQTKMNRLNILTALTSNYKIEFDVSKNVFFPKPKVDSAVIKLTPKNKYNFEFSKLEIFTKMIFKYKRKKIHNVIPKEILQKLINYNNLKINNKILNSRAEDLTTNEIFDLFKEFSRI